MFRFSLLAGAACLFMIQAQAAPVEPQAGQAVVPKKIRLVEPQLHIAKGGAGAPQVALTLDACMGKTDRRILDALVQNRIPATLFVTARWLKQNPDAVAILKANPDLFEIENHGAMHVPAITSLASMYGIPTAGSLDRVRAEIEGGAAAIVATGAARPVWYRDATARYSTDAVRLAENMGYRIAGYSLNGDMGASLPAEAVARRIAAAGDGDVIIAHINQPGRPAGAGVVKGIEALKKKGMKFVRLQDVETSLTLDQVAGSADRSVHPEKQAPGEPPRH